MALPVLDGNQSATTLSSVVTGGEHIVAHSVVSLGATAISNINSAVSGTAVTIPGLARIGNSIASDGTADANLDFIKIGGHQDGQNQVAHIVHVSAGGAMKVDASGSSVTFSQAPVTFGAITGSASILNFPSTQTIAGTVTANVKFSADLTGVDIPPPSQGIALGYLTDNQTFFAPVHEDQGLPVRIAGNSQTQTIAGTVTANVGGIASGVTIPVRLFAERESGPSSGQDTLLQCNSSGSLNVALPSDGGTNAIQYDGTYSFVQVKQVSSVTIGSLPAISGTVTVGNNNFNIKTVIAQDGSANFTAFNGTQFRLYTPTGASKTLNNIFGSIPSWIVAFSDSVTWFSDSGTQVAYFHDGTQWTLDDFTTPAGTLALDGSVFITNLSSESSINLLNGFTAAQLGSAYVNGSGALRVSLYSSTVTAAAPNGSLTTRFGTPTTANTAFATSCVTNANRKYLLIQNVTTGSNVITVGIGFTPTTTQGIQLTAGAGITFESSYIPTGQIFVLSSVTASNFTILEA